MKKIGVLGGTFDPPHIGHLMIADQVYQQLRLDEIWFMPNYLPPHKEKDSNSTISDRLNMLQLAIDDYPYFKIEPIELERGGKSYTYDTMILLKEREPEAEFYFIIGGDMVDYLPKWNNIEQLINLITFVGVKRPGYKSETSYPVQFVEVPTVNLSSSMIREKVKAGEVLNFLIPPKIIKYIKEHGLYGAE